MKKLFLSQVLIVIFCAGAIQTNASPQTSLTDLYKTGKASLNLELRITDENLPEGTFFQNPMEMTGDQEGNIYVVDYRAHHIKKFDADGIFLKLLGREGEGPGEFMGPHRITFAKDKLAVYELLGRRLNTVDSDGNYIQNVLMNIGEGSLRGILTLPNGNIVVEKRKSYFWTEDRPQDCMLFLFSPDLESLHRIYEHKIARNKYITDPVRTNVPQPFYADMCWTTTPDGKIVIGFSETYEISLYDPEKGELFSFSHTYKPVKVTKQDRDKWFSGITYNRGSEIFQGAQDFVIKNTNFPKNKPPFHDIKVDPEGNILVFINSLDSVSDFTFFDAFDPKGHFINRVEVVGDFKFQKNMPRIGKFFGAIATDEDDLYQISLYTISK
ncbi:MAG: 6-bladed beta-propeller [Candidatus Aminicenantes bacterium]|nr:6-bladed beta-propeller [Candidatus Aminicenantes bacterium]